MLAGHGYGHFFAVTTPGVFNFNYAAHSDWLEFLADGGLIGLASYLALGIGIVAALRKRGTPAARSVAILISSAWLYSYVDVLHRLVTVQVFLWALVGYAMTSSYDDARA
jgi:O-antigen ligase